jgi:phenylacetate-CoA ligase
MEGSKKPKAVLSDSERFPLIKDLSFLTRLRNDPFAPRYNFKSGDRLNEAHLHRLEAYQSTLGRSKKFWPEGSIPTWLSSYVDGCISSVPFYKNRPSDFSQQPTINRLDIKTAPWDFVSDDCDLNDMLVYKTSGTTAVAMEVLFDPFSQASYLPQLQSVLDDNNIQITKRPDSVAFAMISDQSEALTYASLSTYLNGAGLLRINLNPTDWNDLKDRTRYLEKYNPEILTGDPFSLLSLLELKPAIRPKAIVSSAVRMTLGARKKLEEYFQCVVLDIYSMTECKMVAVAAGGRYKAIRPDLYFEIFDKEKDVVLPPGERGELVVTGGNNPFLPLIRYRTGDFCQLMIENGTPYLVDLEARNPVVLYDHQGRFINYIDVSKALFVYPLAAFQLHQYKDKSISFTGWTNDDSGDQIKATLHTFFGKSIVINICLRPVENKSSTKPIAYSSDMSVGSV